MLAQVRDPLISVLEISPDFRPAYDPLVRMASALGQRDPAQASGLLNQLDELHPDWPDARVALAELSTARPRAQAAP
jgi:spermidine synthase